MPTTSRFCKYCGQEVTAVKGHIVYAGFWIRLAAWIIDAVLAFTIGGFVVGFVAGFFSLPDPDYESVFLSMSILVTYHALCLLVWSSTPGKLLFGLRVADNATHERIRWTQAIGRSLATIVSSFFFGLGYWQIAIDKLKHQAGHDAMAGTVVLRRPYNKPLAFVLLFLSCFFWAVMVYEDSASTEGTDEYAISNGTRVIAEDTPLNDDFFSTIEDAFQQPSQEDGQIVDNGQALSIGDFTKQLAAVVEIGCPLNNDPDSWSYGSGVLLTDDGIILTNNHVIENSTNYYCSVGLTNRLSQAPIHSFYADTFFVDDNGDSREYRNEELDVALLRIVRPQEGYTMPDVFPVVPALGSSDALRINDPLYVAGYPGFGGETITFTNGVVSGRVGDDLIKTSAKIDSGNSGGAAFNARGEFVGLPTLIRIGSAEGLGYIVGIDSVMDWISGLDG